jgi:2-oxo-3-hexenedioate decarboxylase
MSDTDAIAAECFALLGTGGSTTPFTSRGPFTLDDAYRVTPALRLLREARGERVVGRKIGFTNRRIWPEYGMHFPIWGYMYSTTVHDLAGLDGAFPLAGLSEPRIEPEIILGLSADPAPDMDEAALIQCVGWIAHGFEIVQSVFPGWKFQAPDTVAAYGLHGALLVGERIALTPATRARWLTDLPALEITLSRNGEVVDHGTGAAALDGPLTALRHLVGVLANDPMNPPLRGGEMITTGTLTRAFPVISGERWEMGVDGRRLMRLSTQLSSHQ